MTRQERRRHRWFVVALFLGAALALTVAVNSVYQYHRFLDFQERAQRAGRTIPAEPMQKNLAVNSAAAFVLFGCTLFMGSRMRSDLRARRWEQQLALARAVQSGLMPSQESGGPHLHVAAEFKPALEVGGDLYDVFEAEDGKMAFALGDVSGKGLPAALLMGLIHGAVRSNPWHRSAAAHESFAQRLNDLLFGRTAEARFASLFWGCYDPAAEELRYISAGHCPGFLLRRDRHGHADVLQLDSSGPVLGLLQRAQYRQMAVPFRTGDLLVLYSDGLVEGTNSRGEEFGESRLSLALTRCAGTSAEEARTEILREYRSFAAGTLADDDLTLLILEARGVTNDVLVAA
jgi:sigma-B regulation protein RsbU (phosphoserine phosphatase)